MADLENRGAPGATPSAPKVKMRKLKDFSDGTRATRITLNIISLVCAIILWLVLSSRESLNTFLASPAQVLAALQDEIASNGRYFKDLSISLQRVMIGFGWASSAPSPWPSSWAGIPRSATCWSPGFSFCVPSRPWP